MSLQNDSQTTWRGDAEDQQWEWKLRLAALPGALGALWLAVASGAHFLIRTFLTMWVHESGHAVTAWLCGFPAFPGPWLTPVAERRSLLFGLIFASLLVYLTWRAARRETYGWAGLFIGLLLTQALCSLSLTPQHARALIIFGGDGGCFVLGSALMLTFYAKSESDLRQGWLRWGFLVIGAASFADAASTWWGARHDVDRIPFGENEGVGLSDPSRLLEDYGWTVQQLIHRYGSLSYACLFVLFGAYAWGLWQVRGGSLPER